MMEEKGILPKSFIEASITLISKPEKRYHKKREVQVNITDEHTCKNPQWKIGKVNSTIYYKNILWPNGIYPVK